MRLARYLCQKLPTDSSEEAKKAADLQNAFKLAAVWITGLVIA
jgi:hypothetical protein